MVVDFTSKIFICELCDFKCSKKGDYNRHLLTAKHKRCKMIGQNTSNHISCICGKQYKYDSGYYRHKKVCNYVEMSGNKILNINNNNNTIQDNNIKYIIEQKNDILNILYKKDEHIEEIINENKELRKQVSELIPRIGSNNNTINQKFNINLFLNEKCKDAINLDDFINKITVNLQQLDFTKKKGLAEGISNVIMENMKKLSLYERPIHCTDTKRETLYIKNEDTWHKDQNKTNLKNAIKKTSNKHYDTLECWKNENPDFQNIESKQEYFAKTLSTIGKSIEVIDDKIIKKICNETHLKK